MKQTTTWILTLLIVLSQTASAAAPQMRVIRELRRMVGYVVFKAATVKSFSDMQAGPRVLVLDDGSAYSVSTLSLALPLIVFAKPIDDRRALYRIMFDDGEIVDATRSR